MNTFIKYYYASVFFLLLLSSFNMGLIAQEVTLNFESVNKLLVENQTQLTIKINLLQEGAPSNSAEYFLIPGAGPTIVPGDYSQNAAKKLQIQQTYDLACYLMDLVRIHQIAEANKRNLEPNLSVFQLKNQATQFLTNREAPDLSNLMSETVGSRTVAQWQAELAGVVVPTEWSSVASERWQDNVLNTTLELYGFLEQEQQETLQKQVEIALRALTSKQLNQFNLLKSQKRQQPQKALFPNFTLEAGLHFFIKHYPGEGFNKDYKELMAKGFGTRSPYFVKLWYRGGETSAYLLYERSPLLINRQLIEGGYLEQDQGLAWTFLALGGNYNIFYTISEKTLTGLQFSIAIGGVQQHLYHLDFTNDQLVQQTKIDSKWKIGFSFDLAYSIEVSGFGLKGGPRLMAYPNPRNKKNGKAFYFLSANVGIYAPLYKLQYE